MSVSLFDQLWHAGASLYTPAKYVFLGTGLYNASKGVALFDSIAPDILKNRSFYRATSAALNELSLDNVIPTALKNNIIWIAASNILKNFSFDSIVPDTLKNGPVYGLASDILKRISPYCALFTILWGIPKIWDIFCSIFSSPTQHDAKQWLKSFDQTFNERHKLRKQIFDGTYNASLHGWINKRGQTVRTDSSITKKMIHGSQKDYQLNASPIAGKNPTITVYNQDMIDLAIKLKIQGKNPALLNMANAYHAGGGVLHGTSAQEEQIFQRSNIVLALKEFAFKFFGHYHYTFSLPEFGGIYSPHVQFFRKSPRKGYDFVDGTRQPVQDLAVISCAAYNEKQWRSLDPAIYEDNTKKKIRQIFRMAILHQHDSVVVGAFGCGAFAQQPKTVARLFKEVLQEREFQGEGTGSLKEIYFGVLNDASGPSNYQNFRNGLGGWLAYIFFFRWLF